MKRDKKTRHGDSLSLQISLMEREAGGRLADADILEGRSEAPTDSAYLLRLLAMELLLKATARIDDIDPGKGHGYPALFKKLPKPVSDGLVEVAQNRMTTSADFSDVGRVLGAWAKNFVDLRYPYEKYEGMTPQVYNERTEAWIENGAALESADFQYYPEELHGLVFALQKHVQSWLDT